MAISNTKIAQTIARIKRIIGIQSVNIDVINDVVSLAIFPNDEDIDSAADNVPAQLLQLEENPKLKGNSETIMLNIVLSIIKAKGKESINQNCVLYIG